MENFVEQLNQSVDFITGAIHQGVVDEVNVQIKTKDLVVMLSIGKSSTRECGDAKPQ